MIHLLLSSLLAVNGAQAAALPRAVPYLPQTEALCGGAAAAMVMRYWGDTRARAEDFAQLVNDEQTGIVTTALVADLRRRDWQAFPLRGAAGDLAPLGRHLSRGRPIIALIEDRPSRYHYVVITAADARSIHFHDPAVAPSQTLARDVFDRRWAAANFWMLLLVPATETAGTDAAGPTEEPALATEIAGLLRAGKTAEALRIATSATITTPENPVAWDAMGTTLFVLDREIEALDAWNRAGKPDVDTVQIAGLSRTRFRVAEQLIDLEQGDRLTARRFERARRRLALLPSASASRVGYTPLPDGRVQIDAAIVERSRIPGVLDVAAMVATAPFSKDIHLSFSNLIGAGEHVTGSWRFREGFERIEATLATPSPLRLGAVWRLSGSDSRETYAVHGVRSSSEWQRAAFQASDWMTSKVGWIGAVGFERWPLGSSADREEKLYAGGRAILAVGSFFEGHVTAERWMAGTGATRVSGLGRLSFAAGGGRMAVLGGAEQVNRRAPLFLLAGAGDGHIRRPLLRAHPLVRDGAIGNDEGRVFGRRLIHATAEWSRPVIRLGIASIDGALFTDVARAWQLLDGRSAAGQIDAGGGIRVRVLGGGPSVRVDIARGLVDGRWALSAGTVLPWDRWIF